MVYWKEPGSLFPHGGNKVRGHDDFSHCSCSPEVLPQDRPFPEHRYPYFYSAPNNLESRKQKPRKVSMLPDVAAGDQAQEHTF